MGLDAMVFCDCIEKGRLAVQHPHPRLLYIASNGSPEIRSKDPVKVDDHDKWMDLPPCEHAQMMLDSCHLGNVGFISKLRSILSAILRTRGQTCPVLLGKVLYSGAHSGDHLTVVDVRKLSIELNRLKGMQISGVAASGEDAGQIALTIRELRRLVKTALSANKPISF